MAIKSRTNNLQITPRKGRAHSFLPTPVFKKTNNSHGPPKAEVIRRVKSEPSFPTWESDEVAIIEKSIDDEDNKALNAIPLDEESILAVQDLKRSSRVVTLVNIETIGQEERKKSTRKKGKKNAMSSSMDSKVKHRKKTGSITSSSQSGGSTSSELKSPRDGKKRPKKTKVKVHTKKEENGDDDGLSEMSEGSHTDREWNSGGSEDDKKGYRAKTMARLLPRTVSGNLVLEPSSLETSFQPETGSPSPSVRITVESIRSKPSFTRIASPGSPRTLATAEHRKSKDYKDIKSEKSELKEKKLTGLPWIPTDKILMKGSFDRFSGYFNSLNLKIEDREEKKEKVFLNKKPLPKIELFPQQNSPDLFWEEKTENGEKIISGISQELLLNTFLEEHNSHWHRTTLVIHSHFITTRELIYFLKENFKKTENTTLRVEEIIRLWLKHNPSDLADNIDLLKELISAFDPDTSKRLTTLLEDGLIIYRERSEFKGIGPRPLVPKKMKMTSILNFHPTEIARQLTLIDHRLFTEILPCELLNRNFMKEETSPSLKKLSERFNQVTGWIGTEIVMEPNIKQRRKLISHFIVVGVKLLALRNFAGLMAVFIGLTQCPVSRMQPTWKGINQNLLEKWNKLEIFCSPIGNFKNLREIHNNGPLPSVKAPTLFIKDLTFIEENAQYISPIPTTTTTTTISSSPSSHRLSQDFKKLWNFNKMQQIGKLMMMIASCQRVPYDLQPVPPLLEFLESNVYVVSMQERDRLSRQNEPNTRDT